MNKMSFLMIENKMLSVMTIKTDKCLDIKGQI